MPDNEKKPPKVPVTELPIHVWTPMTEGLPCLAMAQGLPISAWGPTPLAAKKKLKEFLAEEHLKLQRTEAGKAARANARRNRAGAA